MNTYDIIDTSNNQVVRNDLFSPRAVLNFITFGQRNPDDYIVITADDDSGDEVKRQNGAAWIADNPLPPEPKRFSRIAVDDDVVCTWGHSGKTQYGKVVSLTKTLAKIRTETGAMVAASLATGKERGSYSTYWQHVPDLDAAKTKDTARKAEETRQENERQARIQARRDAARAANPTLDIQPALLDVQMVLYVDGAGQKNAIFFTATDAPRYGTDGVEIKVAMHGPAELGSGFASSSAWGKTVKDALYELIAGNFPYKYS